MKIETDTRIIIELAFGISESTANQMIEVIRKILNDDGFNTCYEDIELDY